MSSKFASVPVAAPVVQPYFVGINADGNERAFGATSWPDPLGITYYMNKGINIFRILTLWENFDSNHTGTVPSSSNLTALTTLINQITNAGNWAIIDMHQSWRWQDINYDDSPTLLDSADSNGKTVTSATFANFWAAMANLFKSNPRVIFELANEPNSMDSNLMVSFTNKCIASIRNTGSTNIIMVDGNNFTNGASWLTNTDANGPNSVCMLNVVDSLPNRLLFDIHGYADINGSGTNPTVIPNIIANSLDAVTNWARVNNKKLFLGEYGVGISLGALSELNIFTEYTYANRDVWVGGTYFGSFIGQSYKNAGDTADTYFFNTDPILNRSAQQAASINYVLQPPPSVIDWSGSYGVITDSRLSLVCSYPRLSSFIIDNLGPKKIISHLKPHYNVSPSLWSDTSGNGNDFFNPNTAMQPVVDTANGGVILSSAAALVSNLPASSCDAVFSGYISNTTLTVVTADPSNSINVGDIVQGTYDGNAFDVNQNLKVVSTPGTPTGNYTIVNANNISHGSSTAPLSMRTSGASCTGYITNGVLTVTAIAYGSIKQGHAIGCNLQYPPIQLAIGTCIVRQLTGTIGGVGTYLTNFTQSLGNSGSTVTIFASGGVSKYTMYLVVTIPTATYTTQRSLTNDFGKNFAVGGYDSAGGNGFDLEYSQYSDGLLIGYSQSYQSLGPNANQNVGALKSGTKTLVVHRFGTVATEMATSINGGAEVPYNNGYTNTTVLGGGGFLGIGRIGGANTNPFTISEVVIGDNTLLTSIENQKSLVI